MIIEDTILNNSLTSLTSLLYSPFLTPLLTSFIHYLYTNYITIKSRSTE